MKNDCCVYIPEIVLPRQGTDMQRWAVIACDQHTSDGAYWAELDKFVGDAPSTLRLTLPEIYLSEGETRIGAIAQTMRALMEKRKASQPLELPSAGSTFKRPVGYFAGPLIEQAGLKGQGIGGAAVSEKHAGFVVNCGGATTDDIRRTMELVQTRVLETSGVQLEPEVRIW